MILIKNKDTQKDIAIVPDKIETVTIDEKLVKVHLTSGNKIEVFYGNRDDAIKVYDRLLFAITNGSIMADIMHGI